VKKNSYTRVDVHTHRGQAMTTSSRSGLFLCRLEDQVLSRSGNLKCDGRIKSHSSSHTYGPGGSLRPALESLLGPSFTYCKPGKSQEN